uniref:S-locus receptor kinase C-terminal domain-containing protein n=1 Tax=Fagus sylvatica TaxID=28930 RepID=A0A2N9J6S6_FAGSY
MENNVMMEGNVMIDQNAEGKREDVELPLFNLATIATATNNFSSNNKLGEGGFGPVYKAWKLWKEGKPLELIDTCLEDTCIQSEIVRCLHISFLCLQQQPEDRPNMSYVVMMLQSESSLPETKEPGFIAGKKSSLSSKNQSSSTNEMTITNLEAR